MIHEFHLTARYAETDMMGVIHHSVYFIWAEAARSELIKSTGLTYSDLEKKGIMLPVTECSFRYILPTFFEDSIVVRSKISLLDNRRLKISYDICRNNNICATGSSNHIFMSAESRKTIRIPTELIAPFKQFYHPKT